MPYEVEVSLADLVSFRSVKRVRPCHNNNKKKKKFRVWEDGSLG